MASWDGEKATGSTPTAQPQLQPRQQPLLHVLFDHSREIPPELVSLVQLAEADTDGAGANTDTDMVTKTGAETGGGTLPAQPSTTPLQQPPPPPPPTPLRTSMDEEWDTFYTDDGTPYYHHRDTDTVAWTLPSVASADPDSFSFSSSSPSFFAPTPSSSTSSSTSSSSSLTGASANTKQNKKEKRKKKRSPKSSRHATITLAALSPAAGLVAESHGDEGSKTAAAAAVEETGTGSTFADVRKVKFAFGSDPVVEIQPRRTSLGALLEERGGAPGGGAVGGWGTATDAAGTGGAQTATNYRYSRDIATRDAAFFSAMREEKARANVKAVVEQELARSLMPLEMRMETEEVGKAAEAHERDKDDMIRQQMKAYNVSTTGIGAAGMTAGGRDRRRGRGGGRGRDGSGRGGGRGKLRGTRQKGEATLNPKLVGSATRTPAPVGFAATADAPPLLSSSVYVVVGGKLVPATTAASPATERSRPARSLSFAGSPNWQHRLGQARQDHLHSRLLLMDAFSKFVDQHGPRYERAMLARTFGLWWELVRKARIGSRGAWSWHDCRRQPF